MPRQRTQYRRKPHDFPQRLVWFKHASGLSWVEIARRLGVDPVTVRRWWQRGVRRYQENGQDLAESRQSIDNMAADLSELLHALDENPESIAVLENDGLLLPMGATVSCDTLRALAAALRDLKATGLKHTMTQDHVNRLKLFPETETNKS